MDSKVRQESVPVAYMETYKHDNKRYKSGGLPKARLLRILPSCPSTIRYPKSPPIQIEEEINSKYHQGLFFQ
jgi:hypothetical protein